MMRRNKENQNNTNMCRLKTNDEMSGPNEIRTGNIGSRRAKTIKEAGMTRQSGN